MHINICFKRKHLWWGLRTEPIYWYRGLTFLFNKILMVDSPLGPVKSSVKGSWPYFQYQTYSSSCGEGLNLWSHEPKYIFLYKLILIKYSVTENLWIVHIFSVFAFLFACFVHRMQTVFLSSHFSGIYYFSFWHYFLIHCRDLRQVIVSGGRLPFLLGSCTGVYPKI